MDKSMQAIVNVYKPVAKLTHRQDVMRLYRKSLRNLTAWVESRELWCEEATKIRHEFNQNKNLAPDSALVVRLMREARERLVAQTHPDPYITAFMPGGSLFMRNPAIPLEALYPNGVPSHMSKRRINIDMSNIPDDQKYADKAFVDSASKQYWIDK